MPDFYFNFSLIFILFYVYIVICWNICKKRRHRCVLVLAHSNVNIVQMHHIPIISSPHVYLFGVCIAFCHFRLTTCLSNHNFMNVITWFSFATCGVCGKDDGHTEASGYCSCQLLYLRAKTQHLLPGRPIVETIICPWRPGCTLNHHDTAKLIILLRPYQLN